MEYTPKKVFVLEKGMYLELSYTEFRQKEDTYRGRWFIPLHGMLMEVPEDEYKAFYKNKRREKYLRERSRDNDDFSYDMLTTDDFNGEDILVDTAADTQGQAERSILLEKLREGLGHLSPSDKQLIEALYVRQMTEREYASICGIYHNAVHKQKKRILANLKENLKK